MSFVVLRFSAAQDPIAKRHGNFSRVAGINYALTMPLLDPPQYDPGVDRKRTIKIVGACVLVLIVAWLVWSFRNWPEERVAGRFFDALQQQAIKAAVQCRGKGCAPTRK